MLVDALYGGKSEQFIETAVKFEDGRSGVVSATLKIVDVKTFPVMNGREPRLPASHAAPKRRMRAALRAMSAACRLSEPAGASATSCST